MPKKRTKKTGKTGGAPREVGAENAEIMRAQRLLRKANELGVTCEELEHFFETGERPERIERMK